MALGLRERPISAPPVSAEGSLTDVVCGIFVCLAPAMALTLAGGPQQGLRYRRVALAAPGHQYE
jgi:hypothetical protein